MTEMTNFIHSVLDGIQEMIPEQTIFIGDVVKFHNDKPAGVVMETYTGYLTNLLTVKYIQDGYGVTYHFVDASGCKLVGRNYKERQ